MNNRFRNPVAISTATLLLLAGCGAGATGDAEGNGEQRTLRINEYNPPDNAHTTAGWEPFMAEVEEATDGAVKFELFPSAGLGDVEDTFSLMKSGAVDMASGVGNYFEAQMPVSQVTVAAAWESAALGSQAMYELCQQDPFKSEFERNGVVPLFCMATSPYEIFTTKKALGEVPGSVSGMRLRSNGIHGEFIEELGGGVVGMPVGDLYTALQQGTVDGAALPWYTLESHSFNEVFTQGTNGLSVLGGSLIFFGISQQVWDSLSDDVKEAMIDSGKRYSLAVAKKYDETNNSAFEAYSGEVVEVKEVTDAERSAAQDAMSRVLDRWVEDMADANLGDEARAAVEALESVRDIEAKAPEDWAEFAY
jgi:TRAP-type C4-dicarboxylate transport system substrate-binding protein